MMSKEKDCCQRAKQMTLAEIVRHARIEPATVEEPEIENASAVLAVQMCLPVVEPAVEEG